eukprot:EG_transcript_7054
MKARLLLLFLATCVSPIFPAASNRSWHPLRNSTVEPPSCGWDTEVLGACCPEADELRQLAYGAHPVTDKVDVHVYHLMYGLFLSPLQKTVPLKFFEIGLGCDMDYGPGASAKLWRRLLPAAELWEADVNKKCILSHAAKLRELRITALHGNQASLSDLDRWIRKSGGQFNVIVDDGGHRTTMILKTFALFWWQVVPGGLYFIEDLVVGRARWQDDTHGLMAVADVVQAWVEELVVGAPSCDPTKRNTFAPLAKYNLWRLPRGTQWIFCQPEACAVRKAPANTGASPMLPNPLLVDLVRPLWRASFQPCVLLYGQRCASRPAAVRWWRARVKWPALWLLNPEEGCDVDGTTLKEGITVEHVPQAELRNWTAGLPGRFDVVVDDTNGTNTDILESFTQLWPSLKASGLYIINHLSGLQTRSPASSVITVVGVLQTWIDELLVGKPKYDPQTRPSLPSGVNPWLPPVDLLFVGCEGPTCALGRWALQTQSAVNYKQYFRLLLPTAVNLPYRPDRRCQ